jgi:ferredoxin
MPFVVTEPCIKCKYTDCVSVCPMDCFVEGPDFVVIDPEGCINCSVCGPVCPVQAIVSADEVTPQQRPFIEINARLARHPQWHSITQRKPPTAGHERWVGVANKRRLLPGG